MDFYDKSELAPFDKWLRSHSHISRILPSVPRKCGIGWEQYIEETFQNLKAFVKKLHHLIMVFYLLTFLAMKKQRSLRRSFLGAARIYISVCLIGLISWYSFQRSYVAQNVAKGVFQRRPFPNKPATELSNTTIPHSMDILIGSRFDAPFLGTNNILRNHNNRFHSAVAIFAGLDLNIAIDSVYKEMTNVVRGVSPRFLRQDHNSGYWSILSEEECKEIVRRELLMEKYPLEAALLTEMDAVISNYRFGLTRTTTMSTMASLFIASLQRQIFLRKDQYTEHFRWPQTNNSHHNPIKSATIDPKVCHKNRLHHRSVGMKKADQFATGDYVLAWYDEIDIMDEAIIKNVHGNNLYGIEFVRSGEIQTIDAEDIDRFSPISQGDVVEVDLDDDGDWRLAEVTSVHPLGRYDVRFQDGVEEIGLVRDELQLL